MCAHGQRFSVKDVPVVLGVGTQMRDLEKRLGIVFHAAYQPFLPAEALPREGRRGLGRGR